MRGLTRREFMKGVGAFGVLSATGGISLASSLAFQIECEDAYGPSYFIGVGLFGRRLGYFLMQRLPTIRIIDFHRDLIDRLVFLAGQAGDPMFWEARERVLSQDPYLVFTLVDGQFPYRPHANEGVFTLEDQDLNQVGELVQHLYSVATIPGIIGLDTSDIWLVCSGGFLKAYQVNSKTQLKQTLQQSRMGFNPGLLVIFCYRDPDDMKMQDLDILDDALKGNINRETYVAVGVDWNTQSNSELVLVSRNSPIV